MSLGPSIKRLFVPTDAAVILQLFPLDCQWKSVRDRMIEKSAAYGDGARRAAIRAVDGRADRGPRISVPA